LRAMGEYFCPQLQIRTQVAREPSVSLSEAQHCE